MNWLPGLIFYIIFLFSFELVSAQNENEYDEILVVLNVQGIGGVEMPGIVSESSVYLPVTSLFDFLKIKNTPNSELDTITGFFIAPQAQFLILSKKNKILYKDKIFEMKPGDFIRTEGNLFMKLKYFGEIFELDCIFHFRTLSVDLTTKLELPVIREMRQEMMRANINKLRGEEKADTVIPRRYPAFHFGMADWSVIGTQLFGKPTDTRVNLSVGAILAGGETNVTINYSSIEPFTEKQQFYLWRYANNDHSAIRQVMAGKINSQSTSSIYSPVVGVQLTNTPTTYRRSFGTYQLSDRTEPGWIVELYVNNELVDYVRADASGFFTFQVPLVYGNTSVKLRFYGPWGEERSREQNISIPFNFLPVKELEYTVSGGFVEDSSFSKYARGNINYGLTHRLTIGGGVEYLSSVTSGPTMPFVNMSFRVASSLLLYGEYTYGVRFKGLLSYRLPSNIQFEAMYLNYNKHQTAINYNILEERKAVVSIPIMGRSFSSFIRATVDQLILPETQSTTAELLLSGSFSNVNANLTTYALFSQMLTPYVYSNFSLSFRLPARFVFTPQAQFQYNHTQFISLKAELEKHIFKDGYANISYEQNFLSHYNSTQIGLRYDFNWAQTAVTFRQSNMATSFIESARGSIINESKTKYFGFNNRTSVGRGGIVILPFLDLDCDGHHDSGEPRVAGLNIRMNGGRVEVSTKDTLIRIFELEPYVNYYIELDRNSFDNIAWQIQKHSLSVAVDPNQLKLVEIPIAVEGEASGMIYMQGTKGKAGQGRIIVNFYDQNQKLVAKTISESEGFFSYLGLPPGSYFARIDSAQLRKLNMNVKPGISRFEIRRTRDGDVVDNLEFIISSKAADTTLGVKAEKITGEVQKREDSVIPDHNQQTVSPEMTEKEMFIQAGAFKNKENAQSTLDKIGSSLGKNVEIIKNNGFFKVVVGGFKSKNEAETSLEKIKKMGYSGAFISLTK